MIAPEDPPGFVVRTEAQKAAWDNGFRLERGMESGGWLRYGSTTARGEVWIANMPPPAAPGCDHPGVAAELATLPPLALAPARACAPFGARSRAGDKVGSGSTSWYAPSRYQAIKRPRGRRRVSSARPRGSDFSAEP
jgi:hypothetical protein